MLKLLIYGRNTLWIIQLHPHLINVTAMETLNVLALDSINKIMSRLSKIGYLNKCFIYPVLALVYLCDILNKYGQYVSEDDYKYITKAIQNLSDNSCLIALPDFCELKNSHLPQYNPLISRISEDSLSRLAEDNSLRLL